VLEVFDAEASFVRIVTFLALAAGVALIAASIGLGIRDRGERQRSADQALSNKAADQAAALEDYFERARSVMLITAQNPAFRTFYADAGSRRGRIEARTPAIRESESALAYLETLYPQSIGEACFIDRTGPENARYVRGARAAIADLSPDESGSPFFSPTFALRPGEVYQARPYVSPDTGEWVISNSTPVPGTGYPASAIVHFEVTVESFRHTAAEIAKQDDVAVVDAAGGRVILDSRFAQKLGRPLGRPSDMRFAGLVSSGALAGNGMIDDHRVAFRHLARTAHNDNDWYVVAVDRHPVGSFVDSAGWAPVGMALAALALLVLAGLSFRSARRRLEADERAQVVEQRRAAAERMHYETQREFTEIMQVTRDESEAYRLLKRHLERSLESSDVLVLNRNNSHDRLEPMTELPEASELRRSLTSAEPDACLAVRLGKTHARTPEHEPLLTCDLCGELRRGSTCVPSLVGGEVIGSVLVRHDDPLDIASRRTIEESITQAAPVLANLRNLALSETRALTDGLTGLPNRRAIEDSLKRMAAYADRAGTPLGVVLFDLDHFKQINDIHGHEKGDEVLAAVGVVLATNARASDVGGRFGGEEFIALLPDTDRDAAAEIAERLRVAISMLDIAGVSRPITASFGAASIPEDASEPTLLLRGADRALYLAKSRGRNRVETLASTDSEPVELALA
jgi:diguanylate cyclase (GGDEF)-like protein